MILVQNANSSDVADPFHPSSVDRKKVFTPLTSRADGQVLNFAGAKLRETDAAGDDGVQGGSAPLLGGGPGGNAPWLGGPGGADHRANRQTRPTQKVAAPNQYLKSETQVVLIVFL